MLAAGQEEGARQEEVRCMRMRVLGGLAICWMSLERPSDIVMAAWCSGSEWLRARCEQAFVHALNPSLPLCLVVNETFPQLWRPFGIISLLLAWWTGSIHHS